MSLNNHIPAEVKSLLSNYSHSMKDNEVNYLSADRLGNIIHPKSSSHLANLIRLLIDNDILQTVVRVKSPTTGAGLNDYNSIVEVPDSIHDIYSDLVIEVSNENIEYLFKFQKNKFDALTREDKRKND